MRELPRFFNKRAKNILFVPLLILIFVESVGATEPLNISKEQESAEYQANLGTYYWQQGKLHQAIDAW